MKRGFVNGCFGAWFFGALFVLIFVIAVDRNINVPATLIGGVIAIALIGGLWALFTPKGGR